MRGAKNPLNVDLSSRIALASGVMAVSLIPTPWANDSFPIKLRKRKNEIAINVLEANSDRTPVLGLIAQVFVANEAGSVFILYPMKFTNVLISFSIADLSD
jgi:hypothetical protein